MCVTDHAAGPHRIYGTARGTVRDLIEPGLWASTIRAVTQGHLQGRATGDVRVLGGTFIVDRAGTIRYMHYDRFAGDHPTWEEITASAQRVRASDST